MASPFSLYFILFSSTGSSRDSSIWQPPWGTYDHEDFCETLSTVLGELFIRPLARANASS
eukprot:6193783-Pleurochrysis_carterae.AAC.1